MTLDELVNLAQRGLLVATVVSLPVLVVALLVGFVSALFQAATQVQDSALSHLPKFLAVAVVLGVAGPWMGQHVLSFALSAFGAR